MTPPEKKQKKSTETFEGSTRQENGRQSDKMWASVANVFERERGEKTKEMWFL